MMPSRNHAFNVWKKLRPIQANRLYIHKGAGNKVGQAKAVIELGVTKNQNEKVNPSNEAEERRRFCQRAPGLFKSYVSNIICSFYHAVNTCFPL